LVVADGQNDWQVSTGDTPELRWIGKKCPSQVRTQ
jgi:hypothetical protein